MFQTLEFVMSARPYQPWQTQSGSHASSVGSVGGQIVGREACNNEPAAMANTSWPCHGCRLETARPVPVPVPVIWDPVVVVVVVVVVCEKREFGGGCQCHGDLEDERRLRFQITELESESTVYHAPRRWTSRQSVQRFPWKSPVEDPLDSAKRDRMAWAADRQRPDISVRALERDWLRKRALEMQRLAGGDPCFDAVQQPRVTFCATPQPREEWGIAWEDSPKRVPGSGSGSQRLQPPSHGPRTGLNCHMGKNQASSASPTTVHSLPQPRGAVRRWPCARTRARTTRSPSLRPPPIRSGTFRNPSHMWRPISPPR